MANLNINYMGLNLKNPLIIGASPLTADLDTIKELEEAGAAAIVYKSLFEEQIQMENAQLSDELDEYCERNAEMISIFPYMQHAGPREHLLNIQEAKRNTGIPVIASLNCVYDVSWYDYAQQLEDAGVDALELNFYTMPGNLDKPAAEIEDEKVKIVETLKKRISIPISIKLSPYYTNLSHFIKRLDNAGADAFVLFNRLFQPAISTRSEKHLSRFFLSHQGDFREGLKYIGLLYKKVKADFCGSNGLYTGKDIIQMLLAGAGTVQMVSAIYKNKPGYITQVLKDIEHWMEVKGYSSVSEFTGKLSDAQLKTSDVYYRAQYLDYLLKPTEIVNKYPMR